jgi:hypothetical protein
MPSIHCKHAALGCPLGFFEPVFSLKIRLVISTFRDCNTRRMREGVSKEQARELVNIRQLWLLLLYSMSGQNASWFISRKVHKGRTDNKYL